jgi:hypothetical protein
LLSRKAIQACYSVFFALTTSMMWFTEPSTPSAIAIEFLEMEIEFLTSDWGIKKILLTLTVPAGFILIGMAFWQRKIFWGFIVIMMSIVLKMLWSVIEGGESGYVLFPAYILGIIISGALIYVTRKKGWI